MKFWKKKTGGEPAPGECLTRDVILEALEGSADASGQEEEALQAHLAGCSICRTFFSEVRREVETQNLSISMVWRQERISCPHRDFLEAHHHGSLSKPEGDYIRFHLETVGCPFCSASLEDIAFKEKAAETGPMRDLKDDILRSTTTFLRKKRRS